VENDAGVRLPRLQSYLSRVPGGLAAYPDAVARGTHFRIVLDGQPRVALLDAVPAPLRQLTLNPPVTSDWLPEVHFGALLLAIADVRGMSDSDLLAWIRERNEALFTSPLYRMLLAVISPEAALGRAGARWGAGHRGTSLEVLSLTRGEAALQLRFPPRLFDPLLLRMYAVAFAVALEFTRARHPRITLESVDDTRAEYLARW
jgi:hypothetical protein